MRALTAVEVEVVSGGVMLDDGLTCSEVSWGEFILYYIGHGNPYFNGGN